MASQGPGPLKCYMCGTNNRDRNSSLLIKGQQSICLIIYFRFSW